MKAVGPLWISFSNDTCLFFFIVLPTFPPAPPTSWARGNWGFAVYQGVPDAKKQMNEPPYEYRTWNPAAAPYLFSFSPFSTLTHLRFFIRLVYLFQSLIHDSTHLSVISSCVFVHFYLFYPSLLNEFQTNGAKGAKQFHLDPSFYRTRLFILPINLPSLSKQEIYISIYCLSTSRLFLYLK